MSPYRVDARLSGRHPFELLVLIAMLITSVPVVLGLEPSPGGVAATLAPWIAYTWSVVLASGCFTALVGVYLQDRGLGLILEQLGLATVGAAGIVYSGCIVAATLAPGALITAGVFFAFGVACLVRWRQLQKIIDDAVAYDQIRKAHATDRTDEADIALDPEAD